MQLANRLFFEQVEAMLAEGNEVQIRMKGHSMRPLLRSERDVAVLMPIGQYLRECVTEPKADKFYSAIPSSPGPCKKVSGVTSRTDSDKKELAVGDVVLFRYEGRHILHRIIRIEPQTSADIRDGNINAGNGNNKGSAKKDGISAARFILAGDGNYRLTEHCGPGDIVAVMSAVIRPSGRIVNTDSKRWKRSSHRWTRMPAGLRRFILRVLWLTGYK